MARLATRPTFLSSNRLLARKVARPVARFLAVEASGGVVLVIAAAAALAWANSPWSASYQALWETEAAVDLGRWTVRHDLRHWVNDGLMALFFFVVGLEVKVELVSGRLSRRADAAFPVAAALGGMVVPAAIFALANAGRQSADGWGIPMATDIAFAVGVVALLGDRVPATLKVALLGIAVVDDIGAIVVIALFYTDTLAVQWALVAVAGLAVAVLLRRARVWYFPAYAAVGIVVWFATLQSGVHATIAGVALGLLAPGRPLMGEIDAERVAHQLSSDQDVTAREVREVAFRIRESIPVADRLLDFLHPWSSYVIVPVFALANAGIQLTGDSMDAALGSRITLGVAAGLLLGKPVGVVGAALLAVRLRLADLPDGMTRRHLLGLGAAAGIGFTVSIFITSLAYEQEAFINEAKVGILAASLAAGLGALVLLGTAPPPVGGEDVRTPEPTIERGG